MLANFLKLQENLSLVLKGTLSSEQHEETKSLPKYVTVKLQNIFKTVRGGLPWWYSG